MDGNWEHSKPDCIFIIVYVCHVYPILEHFMWYYSGVCPVNNAI